MNQTTAQNQAKTIELDEVVMMASILGSGLISASVVSADTVTIKNSKKASKVN